MSNPEHEHDEDGLWRGLTGPAGAAEAQRFLAAEFPAPAHSGAVDRRRLLELMAASLALAGLGGCNSGTRFGAPLYSRPGPDTAKSLDGRATYATSLELGGLGRGALVETFEGRPVKIEGNPLHPASLGATDVFMQAEILGLYDPARSRTPLANGQPRSWNAVRAMFAAERSRLLASGGRGLHILTGPVGSPTLARLLGELRSAFPAAQLHAYAPISEENASDGSLAAFGQPVACVYDFTAADAVLSLGADFLGFGPTQVRYAADYAARRRRRIETGRMPRLTVAETTPGLTGARADLRIVLRPAEIEPLARSVAALLGLAVEDAPIVPAPHAEAIAGELRAAGANALAVAGRDQPPAVHALAHAINSHLSAIGRTVRLIGPPTDVPQPSARSLAALAAAIEKDEVTHLVVLGGNPAYDAPADLDMAERLRRVPLSIHLGQHANETAHACRWHVPELHQLESWGDTRAFDGTVGLQQPATTPFIEAMSAIELVAMLAAADPLPGMQLVEATWRAQWRDAFAERWPAALEAGVVPGTEAPPVQVRLREDWDRGADPSPPARSMLVHFAPAPSVWDGRFAGNAWLQELPHPITKQVWGNAALIAPETAVRMSLNDGDVVLVRAAGGRTLEAPVLRLPGQAPDTLTLPLGYGRNHAGGIGSGIGFDAYRLRGTDALWTLPLVSVVDTGRRQPIITTQHHHAMEGRDIVRVVSARAEPRPPPAPRPSLYPEYPYTGNAWGMSIDLDACFGCNACVVACQAENNVPVVGPEQVAEGREMHWLRIDRYFAGPAASPQTYFQPVPCMQCEKAPCEVVCPVNATVHSAEGLNDMVYNRCIGTRTCSNNCPYKVRRFNWFDYAGREPGKAGATLNPDVTVRPLGVMEKCTYCTQRISAARIAARMEGRPIRDGEIMTACQQACPTKAIVFGDINAKDSAVAREKASPRSYALLGELNTRPRTTYLARVGPSRRSDEES